MLNRKLIAALAAGGFLGVWGFTAWEAVSMVGRPFNGFFVESRANVAGYQGLAWKLSDLGLSPADQIQAVNGRPVAKANEIYRAALEHPTGTSMHYDVLRDGRARTVSLRTRTFTWHDFFGSYPLLFLQGFIPVAIGFVVFLLARDRIVANTMFAWAYLTGTGGVLLFDFSTVGTASRLLYALSIAGGAAEIGFALGLLHRFIDRKWLMGSLGAIALLAAGYIGLHQVAFADANTSHQALFPLYDLNVMLSRNSVYWFLVGESSVFAAILWLLARSKRGTQASRDAALLLVASVFVQISFVLYAISLVTHVSLSIPYSATMLMGIVGQGIYAYAILRRQLFGIEVIVKRSTYWLAALAAVLALDVVLASGVSHLIGGGALSHAIVLAILVTAYLPIRNGVAQWIDRIFYRGAYDEKAVLAGFNDATAEMLEVSPILRKYVSTLENTLHPTYVAVLLHAGERGLRIAESLGIDAATRDRLESGAYEHQAERYLLKFKGEDLGLVVVGPRKSDQAYTATDRSLLDALGRSVAALVKRGQLVAEVAAAERVRHEVTVTRLLQQGLHARALPATQGAQIAVRYEPALEVSGDFYEVIELGEGRLCFIIGDVMGKGLPSGFTGHMLQAVAYVASQGAATPSDILERLNTFYWVYKPPRISFVTALCAIYDPRDRSLTYASAGHCPPITSTGRQLRQRSRPLGRAAESTYQNVVLELEPGESVALYTDGISERANQVDEAFGRDRLQTLMTSAHAGSAEELAERIMGESQAFGKVEDDTTLIVLKVMPAEEP